MKPLPQFAIARVYGANCFGTFEASKWVGENNIACLIQSGGFIWGRFFEVDQIQRGACFRADAPAEAADLHAGDRLAFLDGYWGHQALLVLNPSHVWRLERFVARDAVSFEGGRLMRRATDGSTGVVVPRGWDHQHCELCTEKISEQGAPNGWTNAEGEWLCEACYAAYLLPRSLEFVNVE